MLNLRPVVHLMSLLACFMSALLCVPTLTDVAFHDADWHGFIFVALVTGFMGAAAAIATWPKTAIRLSLRQAFLLTLLGWILVSLLAAVPFMGLGVSFADAVFESVSGITTAGSTLLTSLDRMPPGILLWRAFLAVFVATIAVFTTCLSFLGLDVLSAYSATVTAITNVGPGLGPIVGPAGNFQPLPEAAKWILSLAMLAGRLEVLAMLVAFDRDFWWF
ncbi:MAG: potassium transporter TrkG [Rhodospirillaceae bacterium]